MPKVSQNNELLHQKKIEWEFLHYAREHHYTLVDFEIVERSAWRDLSPDQLHALTANYTWTSGEDLYTLRSDWTHTLVQYRMRYALEAERLAYSGPVFNLQAAKNQFGLEIFSGDVEKQHQLLRDATEFIKTKTDTPLSIAVLSHNQLLKHIIGEEQLNDPNIRRLIESRNRDALADKMGPDHVLVDIMAEAPHDQMQAIKEKMPEVSDYVSELEDWVRELKVLGIAHVYADALAIPTQSYYRGIFLRAYYRNELQPILAGGQYTAREKAFGVAIDADLLLSQILQSENNAAGGIL